MLRMIKGGLDGSNPDRYSFISGAITNTRLMGVLGMHLVYHDELLGGSFHQFYYYDVEELGLEHMQLLRSDDSNKITHAIIQNFAGLGAELVELSEKEAQYMVQRMVEETQKKHQPLPEELAEVEYLYSVYSEKIDSDPAIKKTGMDKEEIAALNEKMCVPIKSDYGVLNYYLMRCFGKDDEGAEMLVSREGVFDEIAPKNHSSFLRNKCSIIDNSGMRKKYRCESIIEIEKDNSHHLVVSELEVYKRKIVSAKKHSDTAISLFEAGVILNRPEYIIVFDLRNSADIMSALMDFEILSIGMTKNPHLNGNLYMDFRPDNNHAENKLFVLNDDLRAVYHMSQSGQLVVASFHSNELMLAEEKIFASRLGRSLIRAGRYYFPESIIYDYAESGCLSFSEYMQSLGLE